MKLKRTYWLMLEGKHTTSYFHVLERLHTGNVGGEQFMLRKRDKKLITVKGFIEIYVGNIPLWKRIKKPLWSH